MTPLTYTLQFTGAPDATTEALIAWLAGRGYTDQLTETLTRLTFAQPVRTALQPGDEGYDASRHNWPLDARAAAAAGKRFAYLRASMGTTGQDERYAGHLGNARAAGLLAGAYHYFVWNLDGTAQAEHFLAQTGEGLPAGGHGLELPEVVDVEPRASDTEDVVDRHASTANLAAFINRVQAVRRRVTVIYTNPWAWTRMTTRPEWLRQQLLWLADWDGGMSLPPHAAFAWMHQYKVAEIGELPWHPHGKLDLNRYLGDTPQRQPAHDLRDHTHQQVINLFFAVFGRTAYVAKLTLAMGAYQQPLFAQRQAPYAGPAIEVMPLPDADRAALIAALP
jgi:GH25 family lysozyme M1 (1,4-beta-N-acetylmuramidase)